MIPILSNNEIQALRQLIVERRAAKLPPDLPLYAGVRVDDLERLIDEIEAARVLDSLGPDRQYFHEEAPTVRRPMLSMPPGAVATQDYPLDLPDSAER